MQSRIHNDWLRCLGTFSTGMVWLLATWLAFPSSINTESNLTVVKAAEIDNNITATQLKQTSPSRWIEIDLSEQRLFAWEGKKLVYSYRISTGKRRTPTPIGKFAINSKFRLNRMRGRGYDIPDVPYAMYFYEGYAIHGAYWHNNFGTPVSHGCVNLPVKQARKLYNWATIGTSVVVHK